MLAACPRIHFDTFAEADVWLTHHRGGVPRDHLIEAVREDRSTGLGCWPLSARRCTGKDRILAGYLAR